MIGHAGSLTSRLDEQFEPPFEPVGATDTELIFCSLLGRIAARGWRSIADADLAVLHGWLLEANARGSLDMVLCDGRDLLAYADRGGAQRLHLAQLLPPYRGVAFGDADVQIDLTRRGSKSRKGWVVSSSPLTSESPGQLPLTNVPSSSPIEWRQLAPGELVLLRQGAIIADRLPDGVPGAESKRTATLPLGRSQRREAARRPATILSTVHRTAYSYATPVERSTHLLRLFPMHDRLQRLLECEVTVSVDGRSHDFDDVFGNRARRVLIETPYRELTIVGRSRVEALDTDPVGFDSRHIRSRIPLVWMPWQRNMLEPFLHPPELPESELLELLDYAMRFVERNDGDLMDTLYDLNEAIHREYTYVPGETTLGTTAFDVYAMRRGVCQDFTNLYICLARLMGIPARYVCGYLLTTPSDTNRVQAQASHAWVQVYLPDVGWRGLDPTNGLVTSTHHIRLAVGRNYLDATPTSGTLYIGGGGETLEVDVQVSQER